MSNLIDKILLCLSNSPVIGVVSKKLQATSLISPAIYIIVVSLSLLLGSVTVSAAHAANVYQYTGNPYSSVIDNTPPDGSYTTSMMVAGSFEVGTPLPLSFSDISNDVLSYSFFDGRITLDESNSQITKFLVQADGTGQIISWDISLFADFNPVNVGDLRNHRIDTTNTSSLMLDFIQLNACTSFEVPSGLCNGGSSDSANLFNNPGSWAVAGVVINGKEWRQLTETTGFSPNQVLGVCSGATGVCNGSIGTVDFTGWTWASAVEVGDLFSFFNPLFVSDPPQTVQEVDSEWAPDVLNSFAPTFFIPVVRGYTRTVSFSTNIHVGNVYDNSIGNLDTMQTNAGGDVGTASPNIGFWLYKDASLPNEPPIADAGPDQEIIVVGTQVQLDGSTSFDNDGDPITFVWSLDSKPIGSAATLLGDDTETPTFIADVNGTYEISLVVSDDQGASSIPDTVIVSFNNLQPVANAGGNQNAVVGDLVTLNGSGTDANNDPLTFSWMLTVPVGSNAVLSNTNTALTSFVPDVAGNYAAELVVNDSIIDSVPSLADTLVITVVDDATQDLMDVTDMVNNIDPGDLKNPNNANALTNQINAALQMIADGEFEMARDKLISIRKKTDGCANSGAPDNNDWIETCAAQGPIYDQLTETINQLASLI